MTRHVIVCMQSSGAELIFVNTNLPDMGQWMSNGADRAKSQQPARHSEDINRPNAKRIYEARTGTN